MQHYKTDVTISRDIILLLFLNQRKIDPEGSLSRLVVVK